MTYIMKSTAAFKNNWEKPEPFYGHLTVGAGVRKSFLINIVSEIVEKKSLVLWSKVTLTFHYSNASTGKAASQFDG